MPLMWGHSDSIFEHVRYPLAAYEGILPGYYKCRRERSRWNRFVPGGWPEGKRRKRG